MAAAAVVEGKRSILPMCRHGKGKGIDRAGTISCMTNWTTRCDMGMIDPPQDEKDELRLKTNDPAHDMRAVLHDPGRYDNSLAYYINDPRFTDQHYRDGIMYGVSELKMATQEVTNLKRYALRYDIVFYNIMGDANRDWLMVKLEAILGLNRAKLQNGIINVGYELEYIHEEFERAKREIMAHKFKLAELGYQGERDGLCAMGYEYEVFKMTD